MTAQKALASSQRSFGSKKASAVTQTSNVTRGSTVQYRVTASDHRTDPNATPNKGVATGTIVVANQDLAEMRSWKVPYLRRNIGCVFQDFKLLPNKTVRDNVAFALEVTGARRRDIDPAVDRVLQVVGLTGQANQLPGQLSGGEQQRTAIARALVHNPRLFIADEPTGNLDPLISWEIIQLLLRINDLGVTVLMATHNAEVVTAVRKRVVALENGRIVRDQTGAAYHRED